MIFISDPVAGYSYVLNPATKEATRRVLRQHTEGATGSDRSTRTAPDVATVDMGTQTISGVTAQGKSTTRTIAAGTVGNAQPITSITETWTSPDLQVVVSSKRSDPRFGNSTYALTNIQRTAPDPSLFQVPAGYTVKDAPAGRFGGPRPPQ